MLAGPGTDRLEFRSVSSLGEALGLLSEWGLDAQPLAGGTDVMVQYLRGELRPKLLVHIERLPELAGVETEDGKVKLGALITHRRLARDTRLSRLLPALAQASRTVGGWQIQEVGTIVGNVCNASPAADTVPPLLTAGAVVHLASRAGARSLPLSAFILDRRKTARRPDELVTGVTVEPLPEHSAETYLKVGPRSGMEVALVGLAVRLTFGPDGTVSDARIAVCSVAPVPFRAAEAETVLRGSRLEPDAVAEAGEALRRAARPIDDARATAAYRRKVLGPLLARAVDQCRQRAQGA